MNKKIFYMLILIIGIFVTSVMTSPVFAQTTSEISYPVAELGNCADKAACKVYCDKSENVDACLNFAEKNNMMSGEEIKVAKNFKSTGMTGPGGCKGKNECSTYCNGPDHMDACISFAEKNGMMSGDQLQEAKKVQGAIAKGIKPPACGSKDACNSYCSSKEHMSECVNFAELAGIISKEEADKIKNKGDKGSGSGKDDRQGSNGQQGGNSQGGSESQQQGQGPDGQKGQNRQGSENQGQGNGKQRPPQGQGQGGQSGQNNGGPGQGGQQQGQGPEGQQGLGGPGGQNQNQDQNQGGPENGGQPSTN